VRLSIPAEQAAAVNPLQSDSRAWRQGRTLFDTHCAVCHGTDARGATPIGKHTYPPVPDLTSPAIQRFSDGALYSIIRHGVSWTGMPAFQQILTDKETWATVAFVRKAGSLTAADLAPADTSTDVSHAVRIVIDGTSFHPVDLTVSVGEPVVWLNADPFPHNIESSTGGFHSGDLAPDAMWLLRPARRGTFEYVCTLHPGMKATLRVK
jgi:mono/diheme cytochrome c family protein